MTRDERLDMIDRLRADAAEHRANIARRQAEREVDPCAMQDHLMSEARETQASPCVEKSGPAPGVIYKSRRRASARPAARADAVQR